MSDLREVLDELKKMRTRATASIPANNGTTVNNHKNRQRVAKLRIPDLEQEYRLAVAPAIVPILVIGSDSDKFAKIASDKTGAIVIDGEGLYKELVDRMPPESKNGRMSPKTITDTMRRHFEEVMAKAGVSSYPAINHKRTKSFSIKNISDLDRFVKHTVNDNVGSEIAAYYSLNEIASKAIEADFSGKILPVITVVSDESVAEELHSGYSKLSGTAYLLTAGVVSDKVKELAFGGTEEVNQKNVLDTLKQIKNHLKTTKGE